MQTGGQSVAGGDDKIWNEILSEVDANGDGVISFNEF